MASRIIHLAVADTLLKEFEIDAPERFRLGSILPDAKIDSLLRAAPHYQTTLPSGLITYKLKEFLSVYGERMKEDSLYLGYYLHLIQDIFYRRYMSNPECDLYVEMDDLVPEFNVAANLIREAGGLVFIPHIFEYRENAIELSEEEAESLDRAIYQELAGLDLENIKK